MRSCWTRSASLHQGYVTSHWCSAPANAGTSEASRNARTTRECPAAQRALALRGAGSARSLLAPTRQPSGCGGAGDARNRQRRSARRRPSSPAADGQAAERTRCFDTNGICPPPRSPLPGQSPAVRAPPWPSSTRESPMRTAVPTGGRPTSPAPLRGGMGLCRRRPLPPRRASSAWPPKPWDAHRRGHRADHG